MMPTPTPNTRAMATATVAVPPRAPARASVPVTEDEAPLGGFTLSEPEVGTPWLV